MNILVTGGAGYIGSHTCLELLENGYDVIVVDNLSNSSSESLNRVRELTGKPLLFYQADMGDSAAMEAIFSAHEIAAVIHFAGFKAVGESVAMPLAYYENNVSGTLSLLKTMEAAGVRTLVFSSSATVYGSPESLPIRENAPLSVTNPYGRTKLMIEQILMDLCAAQPQWHVALLRYFNPVGAHPSGRIGEDPNGIPNNLMPYIAQVAVGKLPQVRVFGNDYDTPDGTGVRDYIHVTDLAVGHIRSLPRVLASAGVHIYNLGTGKGYSVLEMIRGFEKACGRPIPYEITGRREGDIAACWADPGKAEKDLDWTAVKTLEQMCKDTWNWQQQNPNGYH